MNKTTMIPEESSPPPAIQAEGDVAPEFLMPYAAAAKAIYVRANGLPAYNRAMGFVRRTQPGTAARKTDAGQGEVPPVAVLP